jgi:hypothetical protein
MFLACGLGWWQLALIHLCAHAIFRGYQFLSAPAILHQLQGQRARPVSAVLARQPRLYTAALRRFWLEDLGHWAIVGPAHRLAGYLNTFDNAVVDRATGLPAPAVNALSSLAQWEEHHLGAGKFMDLPGAARHPVYPAQSDPGILERITAAVATLFHRVEEQLVFKALGQGMVTVSHRMGHSLSRVERWLGRSWAWIAVMAAILAGLAGIGEMMQGSRAAAGTESSDFPLLSLLLLVPIIGLIAALRTHQARTAFALGLTVAVAELILAGWMLIQFQPYAPGMQFVVQLPALPWLGVHFGVDGLNVLFLPLTALLTLLIILYAQPYHQQRAGVFIASVLGLEAALIGMFTALNLLQFWLFALIEVIPATVLIACYGTSAGRIRAAGQFVRSMLGGLAMLLAGILLLGWNHAAATGGVWSFDLPALLETPVPERRQSLIFILLFAGLAVRLALFPLHSWLPMVAKHGTVAVGVVFLVGVKVGDLRAVALRPATAARRRPAMGRGGDGARFDRDGVRRIAGFYPHGFTPLAGVCGDQPHRRVDRRAVCAERIGAARRSAAEPESGAGGSGTVYRRGTALSPPRHDPISPAGRAVRRRAVDRTDLSGGDAGQYRDARHSRFRSRSSGSGRRI